jgi:hypothetical protein
MKSNNVLYIIRVMEQLFGKEKLKQLSGNYFFESHTGEHRLLPTHIDIVRAIIEQRLKEVTIEVLAKIIDACGDTRTIGSPAIERRTPLVMAYEFDCNFGQNPAPWNERLSSGRGLLERAALLSLAAVTWDLIYADYYRVRPKK